MIDDQIREAYATLSTLRQGVVADARKVCANPTDAWAIQQLAAGVLAAERARREFERLAAPVVAPAYPAPTAPVWVDVNLEDL